MQVEYDVTAAQLESKDRIKWKIHALWDTRCYQALQDSDWCKWMMDKKYLGNEGEMDSTAGDWLWYRLRTGILERQYMMRHSFDQRSQGIRWRNEVDEWFGQRPRQIDGDKEGRQGRNREQVLQILRLEESREGEEQEETGEENRQQEEKLEIRENDVDETLSEEETELVAQVDRELQVDNGGVDWEKIKRMPMDDLLQNVPNLLVLALQHLLGALDGIGISQVLEATDNEGLVQFQGDLLGQAALVQKQVRPHHDHRTGRVIDPFAQEILPETSLLALDHIGEALQRAVDREADPSALLWSPKKR